MHDQTFDVVRLQVLFAHHVEERIDAGMQEGNA